MTTLTEMANKLHDFIIEIQSDAHNSTSSNLNVAKYNNLKISMDETVRYPHITIRIGISEAIYNIKDGVRTDGSLGPDERFVQKWLGNYAVSAELQEIYKDFRLNLTGAAGKEESDNFAKEFDANGKIKRVYEARAAVSNNKKIISDTRKKQIKSQLRGFLRASNRHLD